MYHVGQAVHVFLQTGVSHYIIISVEHLLAPTSPPRRVSLRHCLDIVGIYAQRGRPSTGRRVSPAGRRY